MDRHRFYADPNPTFHFDAEPYWDPDPISRYTVHKLENIKFILTLFTAMPACIVLSFSSVSEGSKFSVF